MSTPRIGILCRIKPCDPCLSLVTADGLTWTWDAPSPYLPQPAWGCSSAQGMYCQAGQVHVPLLFVTCRWALENLSVLPVTCCAVVGPQPMSSVRCVWRAMKQKGMFPVQVAWASPLCLSLGGSLGFECVGIRIWPCFKFNRSQLCEEAIPSEALPCFQLW